MESNSKIYIKKRMLDYTVVYSIKRKSSSGMKKRKFNGTTADIISHSRVGQNGWIQRRKEAAEAAAPTLVFDGGSRIDTYYVCMLAYSTWTTGGKKAGDIFHQSLACFSAYMNRMSKFAYISRYLLRQIEYFTLTNRIKETIKINKHQLWDKGVGL